MGGGALYDVGCYTTSAARLVFGDEPVSVYARSRNHPERRVDASFHMMLEFPDGRFAFCDCGFDSQFQSRLRVVGELGTFELEWAFSAKDFDTVIYAAQGDHRHEIIIPKANMYTRMVEDFAGAILDDRPPRFPAEDAERNMRALDACFESCRTGHRAGL
jgi:predicted dehydrogenase